MLSSRAHGIRKFLVRLFFESPWAVGMQLLPAVLIMALLFLIPLAYLITISFWQYEHGYFGATAVTVQNYAKLFGDSMYRGVIVRTIVLGMQVALICVVIGYPLAMILTWSRVPAKNVWLFGLLTPLFVCGVVRSFGWVVLLASGGPVNRLLVLLGIHHQGELLHSGTAVTIGLVNAFLPFMVTAVYSSLQAIPVQLMEAAHVMGARPPMVFLRVVLPLSLPGLLSGWLLVFALSVSAYVQPAVLGGPAYFVLATVMYQQLMSVLNWAFAAAVGVVLLGLSMLLSYLPQRLSPRFLVRT